MAFWAVKTALDSLSRRLLGIQDCFPQGSSPCFPMVLSDFWGQLWTQEFCPRTFLLAVVGPGMTVGQPTQGSLWPFTSPSQHKLIPKFSFWKHHYGSVGNTTLGHHVHFGLTSGNHYLGFPHKLCGWTQAGVSCICGAVLAVLRFSPNRGTSRNCCLSCCHSSRPNPLSFQAEIELRSWGVMMWLVERRLEELTSNPTLCYWSIQALSQK